MMLLDCHPSAACLVLYPSEVRLSARRSSTVHRSRFRSSRCVSLRHMHGNGSRRGYRAIDCCCDRWRTLRAQSRHNDRSGNRGATAGRPLTIVREHEKISIDFRARTIAFEADAGESKARLDIWRPTERNLKPGWLAIHSRLCNPYPREQCWAPELTKLPGYESCSRSVLDTHLSRSSRTLG